MLAHRSSVSYPFGLDFRRAFVDADAQIPTGGPRSISSCWLVIVAGQRCAASAKTVHAFCYDSQIMRAPWVIAHRGASGHAPENTLAAFERALQLGAGFIETDVHLTRDARFVAIHDSTLERTTNGTGAVHDFTLAQLRELDAGKWFDREFMDERIPTLEEVLAFSNKNDVVFYLEIKYDAAWGMHHALVSALQNAQSAARTVVISFDPRTLLAIYKLDPTLMLGLLVEKESADAANAAVAVGARQLCPAASMVTPEFVRKIHDEGLHVAAWTVNSADEMRTMMSAGVDGIMTDFPDRLRMAIEDSVASA
jgi:glycerophosphoryl diester phosphodiesterase